MKASLGRWGGSLALRIPESLAERIGLGPGSPVELSLRDAQLIVAPLRQPPLRLDDLLRDVTADNLHGETSTGPSAGGEVW